MKHALWLLSLSASSIVAGTAWAGERTATLAVEKMYCALCPLTVAKAIEQVEGVSAVRVSFDRKEAVVKYEDSITNLEEIAAASTNAGYPAHAKDPH
jgi:mercuric ion binding protein